jgi:protein O-mannosyl-transferase
MKNAWRSQASGAALIILLTVVAYLPALRCGFIWDDDDYLTENPLLTAPDGLRRIWSGQHYQSQYFPLVHTTFRFERMLWGLNPVGYHAVNVLLHSLDALLVWAVLRRLALPGAWLAAAIWAVHPVNVETVVWVTELKNTQSTLFYLLALLAWMKFTDRGTIRPWRFYALALPLHALALCAKTTACTLPAAMVLVLWVRNQRIGWRRIAQVVPFLVLGVTMALVSVWWEGRVGHHHRGYYAFNLLERLLIASRAIWFYAMKLVWPTNLTFSYPRWQINARDPLQYVWLIGCVAVAFVLWWRRNNWGRACAAAVVFFVAALSPLLGIVTNVTFRWSFVADHYQYVASIGPIALFAAVISCQAATLCVSFYMRRTLSSLLLLVLGTLTWQQCHAYRNLETLWRDTLAKNPTSWMAHNNLGVVLRQAGKVQEAMEHFEQALRIYPDSAEAHNNLGNSLLRAGRLEDAVKHYERALQLINPDFFKTYYNLGNALFRLGKVTEAMGCWEQALRIKPDDAEVHYSLGNALGQEGKLEDAIGRFKQALRIKPDYAEAHYNLGVVLLGLGRVQEAIDHFEQALRIKPDDAEGHYNLGLLLATQGRSADAIEHFQKALQISPDYAQAHYNLGVALVLLGRVQEAMGHWEQALRIKPDYVEAHYNLGVALEQAGKIEDAIGHYQQALKIKPNYAEAQNRLTRLRAVP